jgi:CRISPR/Cas system CSM-associated protein Csm3 (group 7 of RAMP superfamily)
MTVEAELSSVLTAVSELSQRVGRIARSLTPSEEERYGNELNEVERTLGNALRRLERVVAGPANRR